jgi:hypothetical protein
MSIHDILRKRLEENLSSTHHATEPLDQLKQTEWSPEFERLMRNRLLMGRFRYGAMNNPAKGDYNCMASAVRRITNYIKTGNLENLIDVANLMLVEFVRPKHPDAHFAATDDGEHVEKRK